MAGSLTLWECCGSSGQKTTQLSLSVGFCYNCREKRFLISNKWTECKKKKIPRASDPAAHRSPSSSPLLSIFHHKCDVKGGSQKSRSPCSILCKPTSVDRQGCCLATWLCRSAVKHRGPTWGLPTPTALPRGREVCQVFFFFLLTGDKNTNRKPDYVKTSLRINSLDRRVLLNNTKIEIHNAVQKVLRCLNFPSSCERVALCSPKYPISKNDEINMNKCRFSFFFF